jgi:hypothetical protein
VFLAESRQILQGDGIVVVVVSEHGGGGDESDREISSRIGIWSGKEIKKQTIEMGARGRDGEAGAGR